MQILFEQKRGSGDRKDGNQSLVSLSDEKCQNVVPKKAYVVMQACDSVLAMSRLFKRVIYCFCKAKDKGHQTTVVFMKLLSSPELGTVVYVFLKK